MQANESIHLNVDKKYINQPIFAKQLDKGTRFINIKLYDNDTFIQPESGSIAVFRGLKPDGHSFMNTAEIENDGSITVELTEQILAVDGSVRCDISILKGGLLSEGVETLSSATFSLYVQKIPYNDNSTPSAPEMTYLELEIHSSEAWAHGRSDFPERAEDNAKYWAEQAAVSAGDIEDIKDEAVAAKNDAVDAKNDAVSARDTAVSAKNDAVNAKTDAQNAKASAESAETIAIQSKNDAVSAKNDAVSAKTML